MLANRLALLCASATFLLLLIGGSVNPTQSSLACEVGLTCQGQFIPDHASWQIEGVLYEHGHRLAAMTVGLLQIALTLVLWRRRSNLWAGARAWGIGTLIMVLLQGGLGQLTVHYKLPWFVSTGHFLLGMTYLGCLLFIATKVRARAPIALQSTRKHLNVGLAMLVVQLLLGALVRHHGAASACPALATCDGSLWPDAALGQLQMVHRGVGIATAFMLMFVAFKVAAEAAALRRTMWLGAGLVGLQVILGFVVVFFGRTPWSAVLHFAGAASLWTVWLGTWVRTRPSVAANTSATTTVLAGDITNTPPAKRDESKWVSA